MGVCLLAMSARAALVLLLIVLIVMALLFGFMVFMLLKLRSKNNLSDAYNVRNMLARRESQIVEDILKSEHDDVKRTELVGKLRRVKMAEMLIDELIRDEEGILKEIDAEEKAKKASAKAAPQPSVNVTAAAKAKPANAAGNTAQKPNLPPKPKDMSAANGNAAQKPVQRPVQKPAEKTVGEVKTSAEQPAAKPVATAEKPSSEKVPVENAVKESAAAAQPPKTEPEQSKPAAEDNKNVGTEKQA